jgi:N-acyl-D-aspartate/D-glutamate deacylase
MAAIVRDAVGAGAVGFSTSRTLLHRAVDGEPVPGTFAADDELLGIGAVLGELGRGVFELASDLTAEDRELAWMTKLSRTSRRPVSFALLQNDLDPQQWRRLLDAAEVAGTQGARLVPQIAVRPTSLLLGLQGTAHPFMFHPSYQDIAGLPLDERVRRMRAPEVRRAILAERVQLDLPMADLVFRGFHKMFPLGDPPDYEPAPEASIAAIARREGRTPEEVAYDLLLGRDGRELLYLPLLNYSQFDFEPIREMLLHPRTVIGLGDGGAHCGIIADASAPTYLLTHWVRGRRRGARLPLEHVVRRQTMETARLYGFDDRGVLAPGMKADVNVIDLDALALRPPEMVFDLPGNGRRLIQRVTGYRATIKSGEVVFESNEPTGRLPGRLIRGPQPSPA